MSFRRTTLIAVTCGSALAGIGLARRVSLEPQIWWLFFAPAFLLIKNKGIPSLILVAALGLSLGLWRGTEYMQKLQVLKSYSLQKVTIEATATSDSIYGKNSQIEFTANKAHLLEPKDKPVSGSFKLSGFGVPMVYRGDRVQVSGKLYPTRGSNQATISYAKIQRIGQDNSWI